MCAALQARGVTGGRLMPLTPGSPDPRGATVLVTSGPAGGQLAAYAPAVLASFGSGSARIDVRAAEPGGAADDETALRADLAARMSAGSQLLRNHRIRFTAQEAAQLRAGEVDARVLATLAALSSQYSFSVTAFGDTSPGTAVLYREVTISNAGSHLAAALALVQAQVPPTCRPRPRSRRRPALNIEFASPSSLGLLTAVLDAAAARRAWGACRVCGTVDLLRHDAEEGSVNSWLAFSDGRRTGPPRRCALTWPGYRGICRVPSNGTRRFSWLQWYPIVSMTAGKA